MKDKVMAVRPREVIDIRHQSFILKLNVLVAQESAKAGRAITKRELWLRALARAYPAMSDEVEAEL